MYNELKMIWKKSGCGLVMILSRHLPEGAEIIHEKPQTR
jgi:hypothetical protein